MDYAWMPYAKDAARAVMVLHHPTATPLQMVNESASDAVDLSPFATSIRQSPSDATINVAWHRQLYGAAQPKPGEIMEIRLDGQQLWWGIIEGLNDYRLQSGARSMSITARSRDAFPVWREVRRVTDIYPTGTPLAIIGRAIAAALDLSDEEIRLPFSVGYTMHSNTQLADLSAWDMLTQLFAPAGLMPMMDAHGRLKTLSREVTRAPDVVLTEERINAVTGAQARSPLTAVRVKWLDPALTRVEQQDQQLAQATITAGFFQRRQQQDVAFSGDASQRAENTYLVIKQSANSGLLPVCDEAYAQTSQTAGRITLTTKSWAPALVAAGMGAMLGASRLPDIAPTGGGPTFPTGKIVHGAAELAVLLVMASIGTGMYEINGTPYDYVHARNTAEAYDSAAPPWQENIQDIENDFVGSEQAAQAYAVRELIYQARSASSYGLTIVDDPRIEPGDILQLPDASKVYVTDCSRDLSPGAAALLDVRGFQI
jgi:hypothetical protein